MSAAVVKALALCEVRLRMRRLSTMVALLAVVAISWAMIADPAGGSALLVIDHARVLYTSSALAVGSATLVSLLFGLGGFYLARGRMGEDIRSGTGSVIGATPVGSALFLASRWLGGVAYLGALVLAFMLTMLALHALRGDGPIEPMVYLRTYCLLLLPMLFFAVSCAILFDSYAPLMGKGGDVLFFFLWVMQLSLMSQVDNAHGAIGPLMLFDFSGLGVAVISLGAHLDTTHFAIGASEFDAALAPLTLPAQLWNMQAAGMRLGSALLALLPLLPAVLLFHRFSPDKVKLSRAGKRRSPLDVANGWLRPLARLAQPLFGLAAAVPGLLGQALADVALTLVASPAAIAALLAALAASALAGTAQLGPVLAACVAFWGILASEVSTRDFQAGAEDMTGAVEGGIARRYLRQFAAVAMLGLMFTAVAALRWLALQPLRAAAVLAGVFALSALASLFGRCSRTSRTFVALFLFGLYVALNATRVPMLDAVGFNGAANAQSVLAWLAIGALALAAGYLWNRRG